MNKITSFTREQLKPLLGTPDGASHSTAAVIFVVSFFYFLCSQLLTNSTFLYHVGFYGLLLPSFLYLAFRQHAFLARIPYHVGTLGLLAFFLFAALHAILAAFPDQSIGKVLKEIILNGAFLWMALTIFSNRYIDSVGLLRGLIITTFVMIPISCAIYAADPTKTEYFIPIGRAHNAIPIGNLYAMAALIALWQYVQKTTGSRLKILYALCYLLTVLAIILTSQRGPLLGLAAGTGVAMLLLCRHRTLWLTGLGMIAFAADYFYFYTHAISILHLDAVHSYITYFLTHRDSHRVNIWYHALELILQKPWLGYGLHAPFSLQGVPGAVNPHNLFLSALYYQGIPGLGLLLLPLLSAFIICLKQRHNPYHQLCLILLVHAVVATFTNYGQVVQSPSPLWTIYWLPIAMALARPPVKLKR